MSTDVSNTTAAAGAAAVPGVTVPAGGETLGPKDSKWLGEYSQVHMNVFGTPLRVMDHGEGTRIWDVDGNEYLDFLAGIAVNSLGYAHPKWVKAVSEQAAKVAHTSNYFATEPQIELAAKLVKLAGAPEGSHVYFGNSGAEGNEAALKLAKLYGRTLPGAAPAMGGKPARIIALTNGFHGRTLGALSATWKPAIRKPFEPLVPSVQFVRAGDPFALYEAFAETGVGHYGKGPVAAVIMELIQGEAGVKPLGADYVKQVRQMCDIHHALLIIDEVQTGIGRTGSWFAFQREDLSGGITPDIVTFAKGVAGGFPMGGMIAFGSKLSALFTPGSHGSTFAGNPLGAAAALATLSVIEQDGLVANAEERGRQLREGLMATGNPLYVSVRGRGLLDAVELSHPCAHAVMNWCLEHGLIVNAVRADALRFAPPLIVSAKDVDDALAILKAVPTDLPND
ncbi:acetylornithine transaminase [Bifidobacterium rousetti]|uniref:acetylornithine transaminase n=1 Tax=Bifidobacterium rousetti TaxID=2045439 RepID=UPI00123BC8E0|nr:acetylornithine transaminase [Bifidobacterium rousetti]KAA8819785.1 acetylornithine transaminase [Bifidobacterium rousetti]